MSEAAGARRGPSGRVVAVLALLVAGALGLLGATQPWATVALVDGRMLATAGQEIAGGLTILSLATVALALVLPLAGRVWRLVLGALALALGVLMAVHAAGAVAGVGPALEALVAEATGLAGTAQQAEVAELATTGWSSAATAGGALAALAGVWVLLTAHRWPARAPRTARYERTGSGLVWDAMDDGEDPTR
ncbi:Trp biosynthesis-associated membrane protein [Agrococcus sp. SCSIO52902]|uniref:Trp biosynthesis-associated membrane protein n=1 Tax=Agrococcus sp. SCSIO52902 TaxID=2933290 RepID=UPI001FF15EDA|nr:Trp biosynthesis-associated membrane protein [Agrococcus sp. SCSIO52902]UOW00502.1 Trp biosynthesis-associated membrane protein [Agrococcus sp. SCSIO52902]